MPNRQRSIRGNAAEEIPPPIRVAIVEDDALWSAEIADLLDRSPGFVCSGRFPNGEEAIRGRAGNATEVVLMDLHLPGMGGVECIRVLKQLEPGLSILVLTAFSESDLVFDSLRHGADGFLLKRSSPGNLLDAIRQVHAGGSPMSSVIARKVIEQFRTESKTDLAIETLSPRERQILESLADGDAYKTIAEDLQLSIDTIRMHIRGVYRKLHVHSRGEAVARFFGKGKFS